MTNISQVARGGLEVDSIVHNRNGGIKKWRSINRERNGNWKELDRAKDKAIWMLPNS